MWRHSAEACPRFGALVLLVFAACGEVKPDTGDDVILLEGDGGTISLDAALGVLGQSADPDADVVIDWPELGVDLLGLPVAEPGELRMWAFAGLSREQIEAGLVAAAIEPSSVLTIYACVPQERACSFSDLEVYGHDFDVRDDFGVLEATWLLTLHGTGRRGLQSLAFIEPGDGDRVSLDNSSASLDLTPSAGRPTAVTAGSDPEIDWANLSLDGQGAALASYRLDLLGVFQLPVAPGELELTLREQGLSGARAWWLEVPDRDRARLSELRGDEPFPGVDDEGTWLLGLFESSSVLPLPRVLLVLQPR